MLQGGAVARRLPILQIQHGHLASDSIGMPVAAWLLGECLLHWAMRWRAPEVRAATDQYSCMRGSLKRMRISEMESIHSVSILY